MVFQKTNIEINKEDFYTIPNMLCYFRILLVPVFLGTFIYGGLNNNLVFKYIGLTSIIVASLTDFIDGKIARHFNKITNLGKFLDPLADKLMQLAICIALGIVYADVFEAYTPWILISVFFIKEFGQFLVALVLFNKGVWLDGAQWYGKVSTFCFDIVMVMLLVFSFVSIPYEIFKPIYYLSVYFTIIVLLFAFIMYLITFYKISKKK